MDSRLGSGVVGRSIAGTLLALSLAGSAPAQVTSIVTLDPSGQLGNEDGFDPAISVDGRHVAFFWYDNLTISDVFLSDRHTGLIERISVNSNEVPGNSYSYAPALTPDVRYVAFSSFATNLVIGDTNGPYPAGHDVFVRDRVSGTTERVSLGSLGTQGSGSSTQPAISADGRFVAFTSAASNLVAGDSNNVEDVFVRDRASGTTDRVNLDPGNADANGACSTPSISADGRYVTFQGGASNLVAGDTNGVADVFLRDRRNGTTERVSVASNGAQAMEASGSAAITPDGRYVTFDSLAGNLVPGDTNAKRDIFLRDRQTGTTERITVGMGGTEPDGDSWAPALTPDARFVTFQSRAENLVLGDTNGVMDIFVRDRQLGTTQRVSIASNGAQGQAHSGIQGPAISANGRYVAFDSRALLVPADTGNWHDIYVHDRQYEPLTSVCEPGTGVVISCPCTNPPSGPGRGCDNGAGTGGARLSASGIAHLSMDSLVLSTDGEGPQALSIVLQGDLFLASGVVFGKGIRCVDGALRRLYSKPASGGSITAPDFGAGDPTISTRSASLGDPIQPGQSRWYSVYYRDPGALGGCPAGSTFNTTQVGQVVWLP